MSEMKAGLNLTSLVSKKTRRAKARLMLNFGKADKTTDELFEVYQQNFNSQQTTASNLQKHVKHYLQCLKDLHEASKGLSQCLLDMHERDWPKHDVFESNAYELDHLNEDLEEKLKESVLVPLEQYLGQFSDIREKIAKRGRKLVDYDSQRHTFESLQQSHQQSDDSKLSKSRDQMAEAKRVYEFLNDELYEELPALYENRLPFIITVFQRLFASKISYHQDNVALYKSYMETVEQLAKATEKRAITSNSSIPQQRTSPSSSTNPAVNPNNNVVVETAAKRAIKGIKSIDLESKNQEEVKPTTQTASDKPPVHLYKVTATYKYLPEDYDEIGLEAGDVIQVIEYDDPSEQEEGWLMGIRESTGERGLFPANFTKKV